ncbi:MAG: NfeD family protein [Planctomycetota bacterium]|jgi:membrane-bound ClpP family serine protease
MDWLLILAILLYLLCAVLLVAEVFIPSGGIISIIALGCLIGGVALFFNHSKLTGIVGVFVAILMIPAAVILAYKILPKTGFGKSVTLAPPERLQGDAIPDTEELKNLLGEAGRVLTPLRPVGMCEFSGKRVECVAEGGFVDKDKVVKVIHIEGTQLTVRVVQEEA